MPHTLGFSTGALAHGDFHEGVLEARKHLDKARAIELSALRFDEMEPLLAAIKSGELDLSGFEKVSFHAPSKYDCDQEDALVEMLENELPPEWNIIVHPDAICQDYRWKNLGSRVLIENMDRRKAGRNWSELHEWFDTRLPDARLCLDVAHARQVDPTMGVMYELLVRMQGRIGELHMSALNWQCKHVPLHPWAVKSYQQLAGMVPDVTVIIESETDFGAEPDHEIESAGCALVPAAAVIA